MYSVLNKLSEYICFYISKSISLYTSSLFLKLSKAFIVTLVRKKYFLKCSLIKHTCSWRVNLLHYEHRTDKWKYFYIDQKAFWFYQILTWQKC